jgi:UDP-glucose 4-epimerase
LAGQAVRIDSDGEQTRDYVYVGDVADANVRALERGGGGAFVIGTNQRTSVNALYRELAAIMGSAAPIERGPKRPGDVRDAQFDPALAARELDWNPRTTLREGMEQTVAFFRERAQ